VDDEHELEVIHEKMEETRASLGEKVDALEDKILGTVQGATSAVADTVENVKETVAETVETVKETVEATVETVKDTFNVRKHVENHPWLALGCSVATGFVAGRWILGSSEEPSVQTQPIPQPQLEPFVQTFPPREEQRAAPSYSNGHSAHPNGHAAMQEEEEAEEQGESPLQEGLQLIKGLALGSVMSMVRDLVHRVAPQSAAGELDQFVNHLTDRIGGKRLWENEGSGEGDSTHGQRESSEMGRTVGAARW
jgi:ElaB/YqjD/DUF883 family membrane-anchored ribosome-binding protein